MAATSVLKLVVDDKEYSASLKNAKTGMQALQDSLQAAGKTFLDVDKRVVEYARALGQMETTSRTATGKLSEMKKTFTELSVVYKNMTDQEKASPMGKALAASLDQLKGRIHDSKVQLDDINKSINGGGGLTGALDSLTEKFGISIQSLAGWGTALAAGKAALDVVKDAFFASESTVDEWGRVVASSQAAYQGFLTALNTGDISGYLNNINSIIQAARVAYNELDRLGTMKTIQAPKMSAQQTENERMRMMIQTGRYIAPVDGRRASMKDGQLLTPDQIRRIEQQLQNGMKSVVSLVGNEVKQTTKAIDAYYNSLAKQNGMSVSEFRRGTSSMAEFDRRIQGADAYKRWEREHTVYDERTGIAHRDQSVNPYEAFRAWSVFRVDKEGENSLKELVNLIKQRDSQAGQAYSMQSQAFRTMNRAEGITVSKIMNGGGGGGGRGGRASILPEYDDFSKLFSKSLLNTDELKKGAEMLSPYQMMLPEIKKNILDIKDADLGGSLAKLGNDQVKKEIDDMNKSLATQRMAFGMATQAANAFGSALSSMDDPGAKAAGNVIQAISSIALGFAMASANANTAGTGWGWLAWLAAGASAMATTIATIHSLTGYAQGGIIKGNSYSGDSIGGLVDGNQLIGLNAGELVLNAAQQGSIAQQLQGNVQTVKVVGKISGTDIILSADRTLMTQGKQLAVWGR